MPILRTEDKFLDPTGVALEELTLELYQQYIHKRLPQYVSTITGTLNEVDDIKDFLKIWFEKEDFKTKIRAQQPLFMYEAVSPKHEIFQRMKKRIQLMFGSNKSGKSGNGSKKIVDICKGLCPNFPYKPMPNAPIYGWVCSETRAMLEETPLQQLKKWLREDEWEEERGNGGKVDKLIIKSGNGLRAELTLKPYEAGVKAFESANIHFIWCDEPPVEQIFQAMWARLVEYSGWLLVTGTTVQRDSKYLRDLIQGEGPLGYLADKDLVEYTELDIWDNKVLSIQQIEDFIAMYPPGSPMYKIRVLGQYSEMEGAVFPTFQQHKERPDGTKYGWNTYEPGELTEDMKRKCLKLGTLDYGKADPFTFCNLYLSASGTLYLDDEFYQSGLEATQQADAMTERIKKHGKPVLVVADAQINNKQGQGPSIHTHYQRQMPEEYFPHIRANIKDKQDLAGGLANLSDRITRVDPETKLPCLRINSRCKKAIFEFEQLTYRPANSLSKELTMGADHIIDPLRYLEQSGVLLDNLIYKKYFIPDPNE